MATFIDYYAALGLSKTASNDDIRKAYRKLARQYHPDANPGEANTQRFKEISEAYEVLQDPDKRKKYDQYGKDWEYADQIEAMRQQQSQQRYSYGPEGGDVSDFFRSLFGGGGFGRPQAPLKGQDLKTELSLRLEDALEDHKRTLHVGGKHIRFTVPAGIEAGQSIRLRGHGQPGPPGTPPGDLYVHFEFEKHTLFERKGSDLYTQVHLDLFTALLGGEHVVPTLSGSVKLNIKPGVKPGTTLRLRGKGYPIYKQEGKKGDLLIELNVDLPLSLSDAEKQLLEQWKNLRQSESKQTA